MVFVELPKVGAKVSQRQSFGVVESVKAVSDLFAPVSGEVADVNAALSSAPETVNQDPYGQGWMIVVRLADPGAVSSLMDAAQYEAYVASEKK